MSLRRLGSGVQEEAGFILGGPSVAQQLGASPWGSLLGAGGGTLGTPGQSQGDTGCWSPTLSPGTWRGAGQTKLGRAHVARRGVCSEGKPT